MADFWSTLRGGRKFTVSKDAAVSETKLAKEKLVL